MKSLKDLLKQMIKYIVAVENQDIQDLNPGPGKYYPLKLITTRRNVY